MGACGGLSPSSAAVGEPCPSLGEFRKLCRNVELNRLNNDLNAQGLQSRNPGVRESVNYSLFLIRKS